MRAVMRVYTNGKTKPHFDEYKIDIDDDSSLYDAKLGIGSFLESALATVEEDEDGISD